MYSRLVDFRPRKEKLVAIDSDGCVFDTMTVKHNKFFYPLLEKELHLEKWHNKLSKKWNDINLYNSTRGINRFLAVYKLFFELENLNIGMQRKMKIYNDYIEKNNEITLEGLMELYKRTNDEFVGHIINWSREVNEKIDKYMPVIPPFKESHKTIIEISKKADIAVVSSANEKALKKEWYTSGLLEYVSVLTSQNDGSKVNILNILSQWYDKKNIIMIGDSGGDREAAKINGIKFRLIRVSNEEVSWKRIREEFENGGLLT